VKDIDTLEAQFKAELVSALRRAASGRNSTLFRIADDDARSTGRKLRHKAKRIMELREIYSVDRSAVPPAASYLLACIAHKHDKRSVKKIAERLLRDLERLAP
jgi:hypothetical protein